MSTTLKSAVVRAFLVDHQEFMRLLRDVSVALKNGDVAMARQRGGKLNRVAGPHIAFEERVLYPALDEEIHDPSFVQELFGEHEGVVAALDKLLSATELDSLTIDELQLAFTKGMEHAEHCGTLISRLSAFDEADQQRALDELTQLRASEVTWIQLRKEA